jgi:hypothetical protein
MERLGGDDTTDPTFIANPVLGRETLVFKGGLLFRRRATDLLLPFDDGLAHKGGR